MKAELSYMKKENHLLEIKLNEQFGKHDDLKDEFRYVRIVLSWAKSDGVKNLDIDKLSRSRNLF